MDTNTILQDYSPARAAQALDANKIAFGIFLISLAPGAMLSTHQFWGSTRSAWHRP